MLNKEKQIIQIDCLLSFYSLDLLCIFMVVLILLVIVKIMLEPKRAFPSPIFLAIEEF